MLGWTNGEMMGSRVAVAACNHRDLPPGGIPRQRVNAFERWREAPADLAGEKPVCPGAPAPFAV